MSARRILYLGTDPTFYKGNGEIIHYPVIRVVPRTLDDPQIEEMFEKLDTFTFVILTSKNAVKVFFQLMKRAGKSLQGQTICAIGEVTAFYLKKEGAKVDIVAEEETQEGLMKVLKDVGSEFILFPRSSRSRPALKRFFEQNHIHYFACDLYDTVPLKPEVLVDLETMDEIVFTSPSTVDAFFSIHREIPSHVAVSSIGPVTALALATRLQSLKKLP